MERSDRRWRRILKRTMFVWLGLGTTLRDLRHLQADPLEAGWGIALSRFASRSGTKAGRAGNIDARFAGERRRATRLISRSGEIVAEISKLKFEIKKPELWWPNGQGLIPFTMCVSSLSTARKSSIVGLLALDFERSCSTAIRMNSARAFNL